MPSDLLTDTLGGLFLDMSIDSAIAVYFSFQTAHFNVFCHPHISIENDAQVLQSWHRYITINPKMLIYSNNIMYCNNPINYYDIRKYPMILKFLFVKLFKRLMQKYLILFVHKHLSPANVPCFRAAFNIMMVE